MEVPCGADVCRFQGTGTTLLCCVTARQAVAASTRGVSALSVISLRRNGINTTSAIPTARLPRPSSVKSFAYPGLVATAVVPSPDWTARAIARSAHCFETPDKTSNEQRGVLGSTLLEEEYILRCLRARAITEAAQDQARHAPLPADLRHRRAFHLGRVGFELFAQRVLLRARGHKRISRHDHPRDDARRPLA